jgi:hypothetical protein
VVNVTALIIDTDVNPNTEPHVLANVLAVAQQHQPPERLVVLTARVSAIRDAVTDIAQSYQLPVALVELPDPYGPHTSYQSSVDALYTQNTSLLAA